jgi:hypothetical protein
VGDIKEEEGAKEGEEEEDEDEEENDEEGEEDVVVEPGYVHFDMLDSTLDAPSLLLRAGGTGMAPVRARASVWATTESLSRR